MKKPKVIEFNLAELDEKSLIKLLDDNNAGMGELIALLESLFNMFSTSLRFSAVVVEYGSRQCPEFLETFARESGEKHGVPADKLLNMIKLMRTKTPNASIH